MSKSSDLDKTVKKYILDCIENTDYPEKTMNNQEKIDFLKKTFISEYGHEINRIGIKGALENYFQGLPSCFHIAFYNSDILELAKKWGYLDENPSEKQENKILANYWRLLAAKTIQLFNGRAIL